MRSFKVTIKVKPGSYAQQDKMYEALIALTEAFKLHYAKAHKDNKIIIEFKEYEEKQITT